MNKNQEFEYICADYQENKRHLFQMNTDDYDYDCHDTCIIWNDITFYGVPSGLSDEQFDCIDEGDYRNAIKIAQLKGCLILCKRMLEEGEDPHDICDDEDPDLEYTISALSDENGPLSLEDGDPEQDVYYIHEFDMESGYNEPKLKSRILEELPHLIFTFLHVMPELLAFYPSPLEYTPDPAQEAREQALMNIVVQKLDNAPCALVRETSNKQDEEQTVGIGTAYQFSEDEMNIIMGRRNSESSYPEEAKDKKEYAFYEANGFKEAGNSQLLYKYVKHD